jgi:hypothetical protein
MVLRFDLVDEDGYVVEPGGMIEETQLPEYPDSRYPYLGLIDPYGDTTFGLFQMVAILPELEQWQAARPSPEAALLMALARKCKPHQYLKLVGD